MDGPTITIPSTLATTHQLTLAILERIHLMAEQIDRLNAAVEQELADDAIQNQLIAELRAQLEIARDAANSAIAGEAAAVEQLQVALDAADAAAVRLESNDAPAEPENPEQPVEPEPEVPAEPEQPVDPEQPVEEAPVVIEPQPENPEQPTDPDAPVFNPDLPYEV